MRSLFVSLIFCLVAIQIQSIQSAKILFLLPVASKSHVHVFEPLIRALGEKGHEVTNLSPVKSPDMPPTVRQIVAVPITEIFKDFPDPFHMRKAGKLAQFANTSMEYITDACEAVFDSDQVQHMLKNDKFDLIIVDIMLNYCMLGIVPYYKAPFIYITTMVAPSYILDTVGNRLPSSFVPSPFLELSDRMNFLERTKNFAFNLFMDIMGYLIFMPTLEKVYIEKMGIESTIHEISANVSMVLMNSHFTLTYPRPSLPDVVEVGGMHTKEPKPLPKDLEDFLSGAEHGFIFFSLGSIVQAKNMPEEYRKIFLNVFSRLKQRVIWKWETETMPETLPKNVKLSKWLPQQDVLGHKNIRLFITHGGLLSIQETVYHGVPLIGIPLFADQDLNAKQAEKAGFSLTLEILDMTEETLERKIHEVIDNPKFHKRAKELSTLWKDQLQTPLETAVFWSEYVIRHKGAPHMRSASRDLNLVQYHSIDVIVFLLLLLVGILLGVKYTLIFLCKKICGNSSSKENKRVHFKKNN